MDSQAVLEIIAAFRRENLTELSLESGDFKLSLKAEPQVSSKAHLEPLTPVSAPASGTENPAPEPEFEAVLVRAPLVGTFYQAPEAGASPYVTVGQEVAAGDIICIIEAMKMMNYIEAPVAGIVRAVRVADGAFVAFDDVLFEIEENA